MAMFFFAGVLHYDLHSFRGESFLAPTYGQERSDALARDALKQRTSHSGADCTGKERVAIGYVRLPVTAEACKEARGQTLQRPVVLRQFWRHPSWPDPDDTFIWQPRQGGGEQGHAATVKLMTTVEPVGPTVTPTAAPTIDNNTFRCMYYYSPSIPTTI